MDILAIFFFIFVVGAFFAPTIFKGKLPVPADALVGLYHPWRDTLAKDYPRGVPFKNFLITDPVRQQIPWRKIVTDELRKGKLPLWDPYSFSGTSLLGNIQAGALYPLNIFFFLLPFPIAWTILIMFQPALAGLFMYAFLRHKHVSELASLLGAISWSLSGFSVAWLTWGTMMHVALWLPLILLAIDKLTESKRWLAVLVAGLCMQLFAGHAQISFYVLILSVFYALWRKRFQLLLGGLSLFVVITSVQWIPLLRTSLESSRLLDAESWTKPGWFLPWRHLVQYLAPDFFGNPATMNYWGEWNYGEFVGYVGVIGLIFAIYALLQRNNKFWVAALGIAFLFLLPTPIAKLPYYFKVPVLSSLQPTRLTVIVDFILALLAAFGFDAWQKAGGRKKWWSVVGLGSLLGLLWLIAGFQHLEIIQRNLVFPSTIFLGCLTLLVFRAKFQQKLLIAGAAFALVALSAFDQLRFATKFTPFTQPEYFFPTSKVIEFLQKQPKPFRILSLNKEIMPPNVSGMYGLETIEGYDPIVNSRYEEFFAALARGRPDITEPFGFNRILTTERIDSPLIPLLNVTYVLSLTDREEPYLVKVFAEGGTRVYEDKRALPRIYLVEGARMVSDKQKIIDALYDPAFQPRKTAIVEEPVSILSVPLSADETAEITSYENSSITVSVTTRVPQLLVVANSWSPSWRVTIDGKMAKLLVIDYILQGVIVPEGSHVVKLTYSPI